jgi:hypothetical protein
MGNITDAIVFEGCDKTLAKELVLSNPRFTLQDIRSLAEIGALTTEDAQVIVSDRIKCPVTPEKKHCKDILHKKATILLAQEKNDPDFQTFMQLHEQMRQLCDKFEERYGAEATVNQGSLIGKLLGKLSKGSFRNISCVEKIDAFQ